MVDTINTATSPAKPLEAPDTPDFDCHPSTPASKEATQHQATPTVEPPILVVPLHTQALYWAASAATVAISHLLHRTIPQRLLIAPTLFLFLALSLALPKLLNPMQTWKPTRSTLPFIILSSMLAASELICIPLFSDSYRGNPPPRLLPRELAVRFCLAYGALAVLDGASRPHARRIVPTVPGGLGSAPYAWCSPSTYPRLRVNGQFAWERDDWRTGWPYAVLGLGVTNALCAVLAGVLGQEVTVLNMLVMGGAGCLGRAPSACWPAEVFLKPVHDLSFWFCVVVLQVWGECRARWGGGV